MIRPTQFTVIWILLLGAHLVKDLGATELGLSLSVSQIISASAGGQVVPNGQSAVPTHRPAPPLIPMLLPPPVSPPPPDDAGPDSAEDHQGGGPPMMGGGMMGSATLLNLSAGFLPSRSWALSLNVNCAFSQASSGDTGAGVGTGMGTNTSSSPAPVIQGGLSVRPTRALQLSAVVTETTGDLSGPGGVPAFAPFGAAAPPSGQLQDSTVIQLGADLNLSRETVVVLTVPFGSETGAWDPSLGVRVVSPLTSGAGEGILLFLSLQATAPFSGTSQTEGKITTLTAMLSPSYHNGPVLLGLSSNLSYAFFSPALYPSPPAYGTRALASPSNIPPGGGPPGPPPGGMSPPGGALLPNGPAGSATVSPTQLATSQSVFLGFRLSREISILTAAGFSFVRRLDESTSWMSQATALSVTYSPGSLSLGASLSFMSDPLQDQTLAIPTSPSVGLSLRYVFGNPMAILPSGKGP